MTATKKRPYVRPRIGHSMLRSLWYLFAFLGVIVVAFLLPRGTVMVPQFDGDWLLHSERATGGLPAGQVELMVIRGRYVLHYSAADSDARGPRGIEIGDLGESDGGLVMHPQRGFYQDANGDWHDRLPASRHFSMHFEGERLILEDAAGSVLTGFSRPQPTP